MVKTFSQRIRFTKVVSAVGWRGRGVGDACPETSRPREDRKWTG